MHIRHRCEACQITYWFKDRCPICNHQAGIKIYRFLENEIGDRWRVVGDNIDIEFLDKEKAMKLYTTLHSQHRGVYEL